jgi:hypothetical protein
MWVAVAVGLPALARALHAAADVVESRRGAGPTSHRLHLVGRGAEHLGYHLSGPRRRNRQVNKTSVWR